MRREGKAEESAEATAEAEPCCASPAGESPARVIAGEPGSRPAPEAERPTGEALCQKPDVARAAGGKQQRGPQHEVKPAASTEDRSGSRAAHSTAEETAEARDPPLAFSARHEADPVTREGADPEVTVPRGSSPGHRRLEPGAPGMGQLLPLLEPRGSSPAWNCDLSGATLLEQGGRVMLRLERSSVSRVREIRMHGLKGGLAGTRPWTGKG